MDEPPFRERLAASLSWPTAEPDADLLAAVEGILAVSSVRRTVPDEQRRGGDPFRRVRAAVEIRGRLLVPSEEAYERLAERYRALGYIAVLRREGAEDLVAAVPGALPSGHGRYRVAVALFLATFASTLFVGALSSPGEGGGFSLLAGLPFALSLMGILLAHEMGHFLMARHLGVPASPPFFIPLPVPPFGTLGAVMQMKAPPRNRRALLAVAVAGPLAGLAVAIPVLLLGLSLSPVERIVAGPGSVQEGNSLLYLGLKYVLFGRVLPSGGFDVLLHPVAWAGWAGLFITGLNLIPAGQLDGGHVAYVLLGERAKLLTWVIVGALLSLSFLWQGWLLWAGLVLVFGRVHAVPLDDVTPLRPGQRVLAALVLALFFVVFMPVPLKGL